MKPLTHVIRAALQSQSSALIILTSLFLAAPLARAQSDIPLPPSSETHFTSAEDAALLKARSVVDERKFLPAANLAFDVLVQNPNSRAIRCLNTTFLAYLAPIEDRCEKADYSKFIDINAGRGPIDIPAYDDFPVNIVGNQEREERSKDLKKDLEFCSRAAWNLDCGFSCSNGKKYGETWEELIPGGRKKYRCEANGEARLTSPVLCESGYLRDIQNERCLIDCGPGTKANSSFTACEAITCAGGVAVGQSRSSPIFDGKGRSAGFSTEICQPSGFYDVPVVSCFDDFLKAGMNECAHKDNSAAYYLSMQHPDCSGFDAAYKDVCTAATSRWCQANYGYPVGIIQQVAGEKVGISCFKSSPELVPPSYPAVWDNEVHDIPIDWKTVSLFCQNQRGKDVGILQENWGSALTVSCFDEEASVFVPIAETGCNVRNIVETGITCRHDAAKACVRLGYNTGIIKNMNYTGLEVSCFGWSTSLYKEAPFTIK